ncbi:MAG: methyltransferase family protein, partial [Promethearchaeota archaeon]
NVLKKEGGMEEGKGFVTTKLVDTGIYGFIRHPIYLSLAYLFVGFALISQHPLSLIFGFTMTLCCYYFMIEEEELTIKKFGEEYLQYMKNVPRSNLLIGIWRIFRRKDI